VRQAKGRCVRVHIVAPQWDEDKIIPRLAGHLVRAHGWSMSGAPDNMADCNVFFPYLMWRRSRFLTTPTIGFFTHREENWPEKEQQWAESAMRMGLRVSMCAKYLRELLPYGRSIRIPPPVELDKFVLADRMHPKRDRPLLGFSGFVYKRSGRKGEGLAARLQEQEGQRYELCAAGEGWPISTKFYTWAHMQRFYRKLDVYVCTAMVEGGPVTPLEALATGVPVVVPRGVGLLDELPEVEGVYRYPRGDYDGMIRAIRQAVEVPGNPEELRRVVEYYTVDRWNQSWLEAVESMVEKEVEIPPEVIADIPDWHGRAGVYCVAYGEPSRRCAATMIAGLKRHMPDLPVALVTDRPLGPEDVTITQPDRDIGGRWLKTQMYDLAPQEWQYVLYLDVDIEVTAPVGFLFDALQSGWDVCITLNPSKYHIIKYMSRPDNHEEVNVTINQIGTEEAIQLQGGVISFRRNPRTERTLKAWHEEWQRWGKRDQAALLRAVYKYPVKLYVLGYEWNTSTRYHKPERTAGILHHQMQARRHEGIVWGRNDSKEAWQAVEDWKERHP